MNLYCLLTSSNYVYTIIVTVSNYVATVIKTGNSIALRVPKQYAVDADLVPGEKVLLNLPRKQKVQNHSVIRRLIGKLKELNTFSNITDPVEWQREIRKDHEIIGR